MRVLTSAEVPDCWGLSWHNESSSRSRRGRWNCRVIHRRNATCVIHAGIDAIGSAAACAGTANDLWVISFIGNTGPKPWVGDCLAQSTAVARVENLAGASGYGCQLTDDYAAEMATGDNSNNSVCATGRNSPRHSEKFGRNR